MRNFVVAVATLTLVPLVSAPQLSAQDADRTVADGGIMVDGWNGRIDRRAMSRGMTANDSRFTMEGESLRLAIGPAAFYWKDGDQATGDYEVKASFFEHQSNGDHPHPYGIFIGGSDLESETEKLMYCIAYSDGSYTAKTFHGEDVSTVQDRVEHAAVNKANADGQVTNEVGWRVQDGAASCVINGTAVATFPASDLIGPGKLDSLNGAFGIRVSHNVDLTVSDFGLVR